MYVPSCHQAGIVYLNTQHTVLYNNPPPLLINGTAVRQERHSRLDSDERQCPNRFEANDYFGAMPPAWDSLTGSMAGPRWTTSAPGGC